MIKNFILIVLAVVSFSLENTVVSAASDLAQPIAVRMAAPTSSPLSSSLQKGREALVFHATNPRYAVASGVASVQKATALIQRIGLPTLQPIRAL